MQRELMRYRSQTGWTSSNEISTRIVQLPSTAAIEYVAAFGRARGDFCPGVLLSGGSFTRGTFGRGDFCPGAYARSPKFNAYTHSCNKR